MSRGVRGWIAAGILAVAAANFVTPTVVPTVVPRALMDQNIAIAIAAIVLANSFRGSKRLLTIPLTLLSSNVLKG